MAFTGRTSTVAFLIISPGCSLFPDLNLNLRKKVPKQISVTNKILHSYLVINVIQIKILINYLLLFNCDRLNEFQSDNIVRVRGVSPKKCLSYIQPLDSERLVRFKRCYYFSFRVQVSLKQRCFLEVFILQA